MNESIRILLIDDHAVIRESLRTAIDRQPGLRIVGEADSCRRTVELVDELHPDVLVLDLNLRDGHGWVVLERLGAGGRLPPTLVLSVCEEAVFARRLLAAGARGYLMKEAPLLRVVQAIRGVHRGLMVASEMVTSQRMAEAVGRGPVVAPEESGGEELGVLRARVLQICAMFGHGLRAKEIAFNLDVSAKTVATYKVRIMEKLGAASTPELVERFRALGLPAREEEAEAKRNATARLPR